MSEIDELRARHGVRLLKDEEEGYPAAKLPNGVYGFTYSPGQDETPVFAKQPFHGFEVHKLPDGAERLIGYITPQEFAILEARKPGTEVRLYPDDNGESKQLAAVDLTNTTRAKRTPPREDGNPYRVIFE